MLASTMLAGLAAGAMAQGLITPDHIGKPDAPNTLTMRMNPDQSPGNNPHKEIGEKHAAAWEKWAEAHPDWQVNVEYFSQDIGAEHARLLEQARAGRAPDCVTVDLFQLALFVKNGVLQPLDEFFTKEEIDDLFPFIKEGITGPDGHIYAWWWGTDLRVLYYNSDIVKTVPQTWDELKATALEASKTGVDGVLFNGGRWEGTTFDWLANFWAQGGARRRRGEAHLRRGREQGEDAEGPQLLQGPRRLRAPPRSGSRRSRPTTTSTPRRRRARPRCSSAATGSTSSSARR
ncbi:MAG: extracellular solute-binding protein [Amaricoccus sp.]